MPPASKSTDRRRAHGAHCAKPSRAFVACSHCRRRKIRCLTNDVTQEPCRRCVQKGLFCEYRAVSEDEKDSLSASPTAGSADLSEYGGSDTSECSPYLPHHTLLPSPTWPPPSPNAWPVPSYVYPVEPGFVYNHLPEAGPFGHDAFSSNALSITVKQEDEQQFLSPYSWGWGAGLQ
ncbi:unnamed protein product [Mycena citricolor]|uniref:Zn(2)-C6 fungal-type domain-containing protein n=1 Tax=Mycena citricolor TaxID=2018698 RepID=A0AAD2Q097_9AGAR|nr:unnamed protein product [Mycena citricolor]CAK5261965.1 unnamed protein product [Mycena citricolor]CAK5274540.1 unnamed protein product [Mycena citricolor]